jgi:general secretion pathway protein L
MARLILGIDLGASAVKGVLVDSTYRGFTVAGAATPAARRAANTSSRQNHAAYGATANRR